MIVGTATVAKNIFRVVEHIQFEDIQNQSHGYFGLLGIVNAIAPLPIPLTVSALTRLYDENKNSSYWNTNFTGCAHI